MDVRSEGVETQNKFAAQKYILAKAVQGYFFETYEVEERNECSRKPTPTLIALLIRSLTKLFRVIVARLRTVLLNNPNFRSSSRIPAVATCRCLFQQHGPATRPTIHSETCGGLRIRQRDRGVGCRFPRALVPLLPPSRFEKK